MTVLAWDLDEVASYTDATCDVHGIQVDMGNPDDHWNFDTGHAVIELDNRDGRWSRYTVDGTATQHGPGYPIAIWAHERDSGSDWWMFNGVIARWDEYSTAGVIVVEAFDMFATLSQPIGGYTPGVNGQTPGPRLADIATIAGRATMARRFAAGSATLTAQPTKQSPLEEMQTVASSDGGALFTDADGAVVYLGRNWRIGRTDQPFVPAASDNVCAVGLIEVWNAVLSNNDTGLADTVIFQNVAGLRAVQPVGAVNPAGVVFTETDHQWTTQTDGDALAAVVYANHRDPRINVESFDLYLFDPMQPDLYRAVEWRLLDVLRFVHDTQAVDGFNRIDVNTLIRTITHTITPENWVMSVSTTKAMAPNAVLVWNPPGDAYVWNDTNAVWGF